MIGKRLLHYEVTAKLGEGGMGEVYRATDSKLGREVAIKVLPAAFTEDAERLARFEREARVLAALEHPNIAGIYGLEEADGQQLLVMQLAHGQDLSSRLKQGPIPAKDALAIAAQIAHALESAHERGIVHRDLKPANVMLAPDGAVKVLDFGLAKSWDEGPASDPNLTASPTLTAQMTQAGMILGTAGYMSPEQARGQEADRRSDIWSFGVLLHEMLTGQRIFQADTVSDTLARVLMADPDWEAIDATVPAAIAGILRRTLERDVSRRLQAIGEARIAIEDYLAEPEAPTGVPSPAEPSGRDGARRWGQIAVWILVGMIAGWLASSGLRPEAAPTAGEAPFRFAVQHPGNSILITEDVHAIAMSHDGNTVAFVADYPDQGGSGIYLKTRNDAQPRILVGADGARNPFFSPDDEWLGFFTDSELRKISLTGGTSLPITPTSDRRGAVWHSDGTIYFVPHSDGPVLRISENGGESSPVSTLDEARRERTHRWPSLLPGSRGLLYTSDTFESTEFYDDARIEWVDPATGESKVVLEGSSRAVFSLPNHLLFARDGSLYAIEFDLDKIETVGSPTLVLPNVSTTVASGAVQFALSAEGSLAYLPGGKSAEMWDIRWMLESDDQESEPVALEVGQYVQLAMSPTGDRIALIDASQQSTDLWIYDIEHGSKSRLTFEGNSFDPLWTPDGKTVIYRSARVDTSGVYAKPADGRGNAELLVTTETVTWPIDITSDGRFLLATIAEKQERDGNQIWLLDLEGEQEPQLLFDELVAGNYADISPDGNWIAYSSRSSGMSHIYVRPFPSGAGKWQVSTEASREPRWSDDGERLFFRTAMGFKYVETDLDETFRASAPQRFTLGNVMSPFSHTYSVAPDGQRILMLLPTDSSVETPIHVVMNWRAELEELMRPADD